MGLLSGGPLDFHYSWDQKRRARHFGPPVRVSVRRQGATEQDPMEQGTGATPLTEERLYSAGRIEEGIRSEALAGATERNQVEQGMSATPLIGEEHPPPCGHTMENLEGLTEKVEALFRQFIYKLADLLDICKIIPRDRFPGIILGYNGHPEALLSDFGMASLPKLLGHLSLPPSGVPPDGRCRLPGTCGGPHSVGTTAIMPQAPARAEPPMCQVPGNPVVVRLRQTEVGRPQLPP
jgi:hypothetical protein